MKRHIHKTAALMLVAFGLGAATLPTTANAAPAGPVAGYGVSADVVDSASALPVVEANFVKKKLFLKKKFGKHHGHKKFHGKKFGHGKKFHGGKFGHGKKFRNKYYGGHKFGPVVIIK